MHLTAIVRRSLSENLDLCKAGVSSFYRTVFVFVKTKTFLVMRLTSILLLASCIQLSAAGYGQRVSISGKNMSLKKVFNEIQKQSGYSFFYSDKALSGARSVTIDLKDAELEKVLNQVFHLQPLTYAIIEKTIVVKERLPEVDENVTKPLPPPIDVSSRVYVLAVLI